MCFSQGHQPQYARAIGISWGWMPNKPSIRTLEKQIMARMSANTTLERKVNKSFSEIIRMIFSNTIRAISFRVRPFFLCFPIFQQNSVY